jgi:hypothetical protein
VATVLVGAGVGVLGSTVNPFATVIASDAAAVPFIAGLPGAPPSAPGSGLKLKADPRRKQDCILECLHGGRVHLLAACGVATLCCSSTCAAAGERNLASVWV